MIQYSKKFFGLMVVGTILLISMFINVNIVYSQNIPMGQDIGSMEKARQQEKLKEGEIKKLETKKEEPKISGEKDVVPASPVEKAKGPETKVLINKIEVTGVTVFSQAKIEVITDPYLNKDLTLEDFSKIANEITALYRTEGYVTSLAFLPPQKIENNTLKIEVVEGKVGNINIEGNKYFSTKLLTRYIELKKDAIFNYDVLRQDINFINQHPDRSANVVLAKGEGRGETDVNMKVKDSFPFHATLGFNNYNSTYLDDRKYIAEVKTTNMWGLDHVASAEFQMGEAGRFQLWSGRYLIPFSPRFKMGASYIHVDQKLGGSLKVLDVTGQGDIVSLYYSYKFIDTDNFVLNVSPGFDVKQIENKILGSVQSKDNTRVAKVGFDMDITDPFWGRNIITQEFDWGIPGFMGGLDSKDSKGSRVGAGGLFFKSVTNAARIQALPYDLALMLRGAAQFSTTSLVSAEQFNIGGVSTVRGYPVAQFSGDHGLNATSELYVPAYGLPKEWEIPYTDSKIYDSLRFIGFIDWGHVYLRNPQVGERSNQDLYGTGAGLRFDIPNRCSISFDYGYGFGQKPSEGDRSRYYIEAKLFF